MSIDYEKCKRLFWTTHLYTLFSVAWYCVEKKISADQISKPINEFYTIYFSKDTHYEGALKEYKDASSSRTRSAVQRNHSSKILQCFIIHICWQHHGNKNSDSPNYLDNEKNTNTLS